MYPVCFRGGAPVPDSGLEKKYTHSEPFPLPKLAKCTVIFKIYIYAFFPHNTDVSIDIFYFISHAYVYIYSTHTYTYIDIHAPIMYKIMTAARCVNTDYLSIILSI